MELSKRVSLWSVEEVLEWVQEQYPTQIDMLHKAIIKHAISGTTDGFNVICFTGTNVKCEDPETKRMLILGSIF